MNLKNLLNKSEKVLFFLTVLFLPTQLGKHFWPSFSSVYSLRIDYLSPTIYIWDILVLLLIFSAAVNYFFKNSRLRLNKRAGAIFLIFFLAQFISIVHAQNPGAVFVRMKEYFFAIAFAVYVASLNFSEIKKTFITALLIAVLLVCFLGAAQFITGRSMGLWIFGERSFDVTTPLISKFNFYDRVFLRPYATFSHPNLFSGFLLVSLPILMAGLKNSLTGFKATLSLFITSIIFITFSRPAMIIAGIYASVFFKKYWKLLLILGVIVAPIIFVRLSSVLTFDTLAVLRREELLDFSIKLFLSSPLFGAGLNNFINQLASTEVLVGTSRFLQPVHNIFLLVISETGIIGFTAFVYMLHCAFSQNLKNKSILNNALNTSLLSIIFLGMFDHYFLTLPQGQRIFFAVIALSLRNFKGRA